MSRKFLFVDTETTGLVDPMPTEIFAVQYSNGEFGRSFHVLIDQPKSAYSPEALKMADESGLLADIKNYGVRPAEAFKQWEAYFSSLPTKGPETRWKFAGSNPKFDYNVLREFSFHTRFDATFHYRTVDMNTICELFGWSKDDFPRAHRAEGEVMRDIKIWETALEKIEG